MIWVEVGRRLRSTFLPSAHAPGGGQSQGGQSERKPDSSHTLRLGHCPQLTATERGEMKASLAHLAYLLRIWQVARGGQAVWRASLEDVDSGGRRGFPSLEALFAHLRQETSRSEGSARPEGGQEERR